MTHQVALPQTNSLHPTQEPGDRFSKHEGAMITTHRSETWQINQVDAKTVLKGWNVAYPPTGRARKAMYQQDGMPLASNLILNRKAVYCDVMGR
jgi:hypothetical protein